VYSTAVGYTGGTLENPTYQQVCSGRTMHNEVVLVAYDESKLSYADLLRMFWESHDPTQGMGQGNDRGTQYRSGIYYFDEEQKKLAVASKETYQVCVNTAALALRVVSLAHAADEQTRLLLMRGESGEESLVPLDAWGYHTNWHASTDLCPGLVVCVRLLSSIHPQKRDR
jgi:methionine-S-sulfoxide reductase